MVKLNFKRYFAVFLAIIVLLVFHYSKLLNPVEAVFSAGLNPLLKVFYSLSSGLSGAYRDQTSRVDLALELKKDEETINRLTAENVKLKFVEEENLILRKNLNFFSKNNSRFLMANIVSRGGLIENTEDSRLILIDKGSSDGLYPGLAVTGSTDAGTPSQGVIIGKIYEVNDHLARVCLVTNKNCKLAAAIFGESKTTGIVSGELGLTVRMDFVPQTKNIVAGDLVATSGLEESVPRGLIIGRVTGVTKASNEVWQAAAIEPFADLDSLTIVAILLP